MCRRILKLSGSWKGLPTSFRKYDCCWHCDSHSPRGMMFKFLQMSHILLQPMGIIFLN